MLDIDNPGWSYWTRINLNSLCVRYVQDVWYQAFPGNPGIDNMLKLSHAVAEGAVDPGQAQGKATPFFHDVLFDTEFDEITEPATLVADAARRAVISACHRELYYEVDLESDLEDDDLLPDSLDLSYACTAEVAHGLNWQDIQEVDVDARRTFWLWYLNDAIPSVLRN